MYNISISLDKTQYKEKPNNDDAKKLSLQIGRSPVCITAANDIYRFVEAVGKEGRTWSPATFSDGQRKINAFEQQQLFVLDFDGGITWQECFDRAEKYNLPILFAYDTFSSVSHDRFRVVFLNDTAISDKRVAKTMTMALRVIFPESDSSCDDVSHFYYGGKELLYLDNDLPEINIELLIRNMTLYLKNKYGDSHYKRKIHEFAEVTGVKLNQNKLLEVYVTEICAEEDFGKISPETILINKDVGEILPNIYYALTFGDNSTKETSAQKAPKNHYTFRSSYINTIRETCQLFREFENGSKWLYHDELYGIACSLIQVETGKRVFLDTLLANSQHKSYLDKYNQWDYYLDYFRQNEYKPQNCDSFCPYKSECQHGTNILSKLKLKNHQIIKLANYKEKYYPIEEVEKDVRDKITIAVNAADSDVHVINSQTSIGKTQVYLELMAHSDRPFLIAVPTNILKHDVYNRAVNMSIDVMETPSLYEILKNSNIPYKIRNHINKCYTAGNHKSVIPYIRRVLKKENIPCLQDYLDKLAKVKSFDGHIITTHRKLLNYDEETLSKYTVIVDEDIIYKAVITNQVKITVDELEEMLEHIDSHSPLAYKIRQILECAETQNLFTVPEVEPDIDDDKNEDDDTSWDFDVSSLCRAEKFCFQRESKQENIQKDCITFFKPIEFRNVKYIVVSATANKIIYNYYFGVERVQFYDCKRARYNGSLDQYCDRSMSRADIRPNADSIFKKINDRFGKLYTITFDEFKNYVDYVELHFGNTEGCDFLAGHSINVVGTPHYPPYLYKLFAYTIGLPFDVNADIKPNQTVTYNGCQFKFTTYNDEILRNIQFWIIETELEQAVGRARLLRKAEGYVNLFSNFPIMQSDLKQFGWDDLNKKTK